MCAFISDVVRQLTVQAGSFLAESVTKLSPSFFLHDVHSSSSSHHSVNAHCLACFYPRELSSGFFWQYEISQPLISPHLLPEEVLKEELLSLSIRSCLLSCRDLSPLLPSATNASSLCV